MSGAGDVSERPGSLRRLLGQLRPLLDVVGAHLPMLWWAIGFGLAAQVLLVAVAATGAGMVGLVATGAGAEVLRGWLAVLVGLVVCQAAAHFGEVYASHVGAFRALADLRQRCYEAIERLAPAYTVTRRSGDLASVSMGDVELLELFFAHTIGPLVVALVVPVLVVVAVAVIDPVVAVVLLPFVVAVATVPSWLHRWGEAQGAVEREVTGALAARLVDEVQGVREVLAFGAAEHRVHALAAEGRRLKRAQVAHASRSGVEKAVTDVLVTAGVLAVLAAAAAAVADGRMDPALLPLVVVAAGSAFVPVTTLSQTTVEMGRIGAAAERVDVLLRARPAVVDLVDAAPQRPLAPRVQFSDVRFRYGPDLPEALAGVSFTVAPGETVALVGSSGAGKSTCAALLLRLWEVGDGAVRIDGVDIRDLPQDRLRELVSLVPQDAYLFNESVAENLALARPEASEADIRDVARQALVAEFVEAMPDGYATVLGERGTRLSGGQRQRVAVARTLLRGAPIVVLDEAVSSLDAESEDLVRAAMAEAGRDRTTLVIAHRLSTIRTADRIVVLDHGRVVEEGTFAVLIDRSGPFAQLVEAGLNGEASVGGRP